MTFKERAYALVAIAGRLQYVSKHGLEDQGSIYVGFLTGDCEMPDWLRQEHPETLTIVLQHQFYQLKVEGVSFSVDLQFNGRPASLIVPLSAVFYWADPGSGVLMQFPVKVIQIPPTLARTNEDNEEGSGKVVSLADFRGQGGGPTDGAA